MTVSILRGDARSLPLADGSVDLVVTSPPYFALRSYQDGGEHYEGQIGSEPTPAEFLDALIAVTAECVRVLKPSGSIFVNLGDKYASSGGHGAGATSQRATRSQYVEQVGRAERNTTGITTKSLIGIPWRYALRCIDDLGLILRAEIIWSKPNGLPESVTDRVRRSHETWFHFTVSPRYFSAVDEIREEHLTVVGGPRRHAGAAFAPTDKAGRGGDGSGHSDGHPLGKLPGSVWSIPTQPLTVPAHLGVDHFAAFPTEWPKRLISGWCPAEVCTVCGEGRRPVVDKRLVNVWHDKPPQDTRYAGNEDAHLNNRKRSSDPMMRTFGSTEATITGYACACPDTSAPATPGVVLDPFGGTGTTALVAHALGRHGISVDLSADYCRLAEWRTSDRGELARVLGVPKPPAQIEGQADLFSEEAS